jgi:putative transposase
LKYEEVHLKAYANALEARSAIGQWFGFYNDRRLYQALHYRTSGAAVWTAEVSPVDLPLRLDAAASPTTPQGQQLQNAIYI